MKYQEYIKQFRRQEMTTRNSESSFFNNAFNVSPDLDVFNQWIIKNYGGNTRTKTITHEKFLRICNLIRGNTTNTNAKFRFWVRNKGFRLIHYDEATGKIKDDPDGELYVSLHAREESNGGGNIETFLRTNLPAISFFRKVAVVEDFYDIIKKAHIDSKGQHAGQKKTYRLVSDTYAFLPREVITFYLLNCDACKPRIQKYGPIPKPKKTQEIDLTHRNNNNNNSTYDITVFNNGESCSPLNLYDDRSANPASSFLETDYLQYNYHRNIYANEFIRNNALTYSKYRDVPSKLRNNPSRKFDNESEKKRSKSPGPPSLCYVPRNDNVQEEAKEVSDERPKSVEIPYTVPSSLASIRKNFYNHEQLKDIENYALERKKIFEQAEESHPLGNNASYSAGENKNSFTEKTTYERSSPQKRYLENKEGDNEPMLKYRRSDEMLYPPRSYNTFELNKTLYEDTRISKRIDIMPLEFHSPKRQYHNSFLHTRNMLPNFSQGSVSSGSSDSTDEPKDDEETIYRTNNSFLYDRTSPFSRDYNRSMATESLMPHLRSPNLKYGEHQLKSYKHHGIAQLFYPLNEKLY